MGKIKKGILGGFNGKVGTVIGSSWRGIAYMRSLPQNVRNPRTEPQVRQRSKFTETLKFLKPLTPMLRVGWKHYGHRQSAFNAATSYTIANAIVGELPNFEIDASRVLISRGSLTQAINATAAIDNGTIIFGS